MPVSVLITSEFEPSPETEARWLGDLPPARGVELRRWSDRAARRRSLLGSRLLATALSRLGYRDSALSTLRHPPSSRPTLDLPVAFSLSHADGCIVCAVSTDGTVGIDVERLGDLTASGFRRYLNDAERAWAGDSAQRFYAVWTRKEAVAKAAGSGGLRDVARVDTAVSGRHAMLDGRLWHTPAVPVGRGHVAHLALGDGAGDVTVEHLARQRLETDCDPQPTAGRVPVAASDVAL